MAAASTSSMSAVLSHFSCVATERRLSEGKRLQQRIPFMVQNKWQERIPVLLAVFFLLLLVPAAWSSIVAASPQGAFAEFNQRLLDYVAIHEKAVASVPLLPASDDPALIAKHQEAIANAIRKARPNASPGDLFVPAVQSALMDLLKRELSGQKGESARETILGEGNPKSSESRAAVNLSVNAIYSTKAPLSTVPASLLGALPQLPEALEFRFVGRDLILRDTKANLILDILRNAVPQN
jgi:hypothetical protein